MLARHFPAAKSHQGSMENVLQKCAVCDEQPEGSEDLFAGLKATCDHLSSEVICRDCLQRYLQIQSEPTNGFVAGTIRCWTPNCNENLSHSDVQLFATTEVFDRYDLALVHQLIHEEQTYLECAYADCDGRGWYDEAAGAMYAACVQCNRSTCIACNVPWHGEELCPQGTETRRLRGEAGGVTQINSSGAAMEEGLEENVEQRGHEEDEDQISPERLADEFFSWNTPQSASEFTGTPNGLRTPQRVAREPERPAVSGGSGRKRLAFWDSEDDTDTETEPLQQTVPTTAASRTPHRQEGAQVPVTPKRKRKTADEIARGKEERETKKRIKLETQQQNREERARKAEERVEIKAEEKRVKQEDASDKKVEKTTKMCPKCFVPIEKNAGCDHMTW